MKESLYFFGLVAAAALGYKFEPKLRNQLSSAPPVGSIQETAFNEASGTNAHTTEPNIDFAQTSEDPASPVAPAEETPAASAPVPEVATPVTGDSQETSADPASVPDAPPVVEATPAPSSEPAPETSANPAAVAGSGDAVKAMQDSIKSAQIKEFTFEQVLTWEAGANEMVDGENYQIGLASYKAETIFGVKTIQAKALLKDGKVQRWIWPKSGMEIK